MCDPQHACQPACPHVSTATTAIHSAGSTYENELGLGLLKNKLHFCNACGYRCILYGGDSDAVRATGRPVTWDKILALQQAMQQCEVAMWVDA